MTFLVNIALFGWIPFVIFYLYKRFPPHQAVIYGFILAWLFLPVASFNFQGIPDLTKTSATSYGIFIWEKTTGCLDSRTRDCYSFVCVRLFAQCYD